MPPATPPLCPACKAPKKTSRHYLCESCWWTLPRAARGPLLRRDSLAALRLIELHRQLNDNVPLHKIQITTR